MKPKSSVFGSHYISQFPSGWLHKPVQFSDFQTLLGCSKQRLILETSRWSVGLKMASNCNSGSVTSGCSQILWFFTCAHCILVVPLLYPPIAHPNRHSAFTFLKGDTFLIILMYKDPIWNYYEFLEPFFSAMSVLTLLWFTCMLSHFHDSVKHCIMDGHPKTLLD